MKYNKENGVLIVECRNQTVRFSGADGHNLKQEKKGDERECNFTLTFSSPDPDTTRSEVTGIRLRNLNRTSVEQLRDKLNQELERLAGEEEVKRVVDSFSKEARESHPGKVGDALKDKGFHFAAKEWQKKEEKRKQDEIKTKIRDEAIAKLKEAGITCAVNIY